nr:Gag-Pol polyprotein [Tanacetum cinerariifolium]
MLDRTDFSSWQQWIRLYYRGKENEVNILKFIDEGPYKMGTFRETLAESTEGTPQFGPKRPRVYFDLNSEEKGRYNADIQVTNILLQGLPKDIYTLINHYTDAKDIWNNVNMLLEGSELTKEDQESQLYDDFEHFRQHMGELIQEYYVRFAKLINDMRNIKMTMSKLQLNSKFVNNMLPEWGRYVTAVKLNRGLRDSNYDQLYSYLKQHETHAKENKMILEHFSQPTVDPLALLLNVSNPQHYSPSSQLLFLAGGHDNVFDDDVDEQLVQDLALNVDNVFQADDCDAFDSDKPNEMFNEAWECFKDLLRQCPHHGFSELHQLDTFYNALNTNDQDALDSAAGEKFLDKIPRECLSIIESKSKPALYNGHEIIKDNYTLAIVHNSEDTLEIAEITRKKMNDKMNDPECVTRKVKIAPHDYSKENLLATFTPQKQLTPKQIFWSNDLMKLKSEALKERTKASKPLKAFTVYPPNTPVTLVPKTKACYLQEVIPFFKTLKDNFEGIQKALTKEVKEMKDVFEELEAEVAQYAVDRKHDAIELKNLLIANDNLIAACLSQEVFCMATNSELNVARFTKMYVANTTTEACCLALEAELANLRDMNNHDNQKELINHFSKLEHYKELYDSIKITRPKHIEQVTKLITKNVNLKTRVSKATVNPQVSAQDKHAIDVEPIVPHLRNNRDAYLDYLRHLKESVETIRDIVEEDKVAVQIVHWYLDSGCSKHMIRDRSRLMNFVKKFIGTVRFENYHFGAIMGYGDYVIGNSVISRVYYVEGLGHNLFSVGQFCDSDVEVAFRKHSCYVRDTYGVELLKGSRGSNLYTISIEDMMKSSPICLLSKASKKKSWLWHRRLNHLNFNTINDLARKDLVRGLPRLKFEKDHLCSACQLGKSKKHTHKPKAENTKLDVLNTLHMDLCGPMRVQTINGKKYILVIVDDYSRFTWVKFLRSKDETPDVVIKFITQIQAEAVATACYTQNRSLIHTLHHKTPYEVVHNKKPDLTFFKVFGALCYPTNDNEDLRKLQPTADTGIFVGYAPSRKGTRSYIFDAWTNKLSPRTKYCSCNSFCTPTNKELEILFQPMFDEYLEPPQPAPVNLAGTPLSNTIDQDAPTLSMSLSSSALQSYSLHQGVTAEPNSMEERTDAPTDNPPFIYKVKLEEYGDILKNKARLVAKGYQQEEGIDFEESFALVLL